MSIQTISSPKRLGIKMVSILPGNFIFQGKKNIPCLGFQIAEVPFTNGNFWQLLKECPPRVLKMIIDNPEERLGKSLAVAALAQEAMNCPLVLVNHYEATGIAELMDCRLPADTEWVRAAAGKFGRQFPWGSQSLSSSRVVFNDRGTRAVGRLDAGKSPDGLYDMAGNVDEWTSSLYLRTGDKTQIIVHGGSWDDNNPGFFKCNHRGFQNIRSISPNIGLRLVRNLP